MSDLMALAKNFNLAGRENLERIVKDDDILVTTEVSSHVTVLLP